MKCRLQNSDINKMTKDEIVKNLKMLQLCVDGNKETVAKRLKAYHKKIAISLPSQIPKKRNFSRFYDYICILDFECTCSKRNSSDFPHEIIEFPVLLMKTSTLEIIDVFHEFCKPSILPCLTKFCTELTGITQEIVDNARSFADVLVHFTGWLEKHNLGSDMNHRFAFASDGPWDLGRFFQMQCLYLNTKIPHEFRHWINVRKFFAHFYRKGNPSLRGLSLQTMLNSLDMQFEGRQHSGIDDARNIARLVKRLLEDGCELRINELLLRKDKARVSVPKPREPTITTAIVCEKILPEDLSVSQKVSASLANRECCEAAISEGVCCENDDDSTEVAHDGKPNVAKDAEEDSDYDERISLRNALRLSNAVKKVDSNASALKNIPLNITSTGPNEWRNFLPYRIENVSKQEFLKNVYLECLTCSEGDDDENV